MFPEDIAKFWRLAVSYNTSSGCFWQSYHTVKSAGVPVLCFRASTCFQFWSKTFTERCTNNSLLSCDKTIFPCFNWLVTCFQFQSMFSKNISCFRFWWKTYAKRCTSNNYVKRLSSPALCGWSGWCFQFQGMIWKTKECRKQKYCIKNMAVKIPILVLLRFCLLWWLKNYLFCVLSLL